MKEVKGVFWCWDEPFRETKSVFESRWDGDGCFPVWDPLGYDGDGSMPVADEDEGRVRSALLYAMADYAAEVDEERGCEHEWHVRVDVSEWEEER